MSDDKTGEAQAPKPQASPPSPSQLDIHTYGEGGSNNSTIEVVIKNDR